MTGQAIRPSQFILSYGVGSIVETGEGPVIIPEFRRWGRVFDLDRIAADGIKLSDFEIPGSYSAASGLLNNGRVFRIPTNLDFNEPDERPVFSTTAFPNWALCVPHGRLFELKAGGVTLCEDCRKAGRRVTDIKRQAIRFVRACRQGHLDDVDWSGLLHATRRGERCNRRVFRWEARGSSLRNVTISCDCGASTTLANIYNGTSTCTGRFPEIGTECPGCNVEASVTLRGSSSLRIPEIHTIIPIPKNNTPLHLKLNTEYFRATLATSKEWTVRGLLEKLKTQQEEDPDNFDAHIIDLIENEDEERVERAIQDIKNQTKNRATKIEDVRREELKALKDAARFGQPPDPMSIDPEFQVKQEDVRSDVKFGSHRLRITPIERLSVIMIQEGYRRLDTESTLVHTYYFDGRHRWFPGVKLNGEGIFIDTDEAPLKLKPYGWLQQYASTHDPHQHPVAVWWHTLSHRIIRSLSIDSGYSSAAIREMVYIDINQKGEISSGLLLYTAQQGSDGTLGGLIVMARRFESVLASAIRNINACSNDPLCSRSKIRPGRQNGAACYACMLLSETSCSHRNIHLDRNLLRNNL